MLRRIVLATMLIAAVAGLSACGEENEVSVGESEGIYVTVGGLKYQVQISRVLNANDVEDREYLYGLSDQDADLPADDDWFALFVRVHNDSDSETLPTATRFSVSDTTGREFEPVTVDSAELNPFIYQPTRLGPGEVHPARNAAAGNDKIGGGLLLFKVPIRSFANRPLELHIESPERGGKAGEVVLDV